MNIPRGMHIQNNNKRDNNKNYVLKLNKSLYGLRQSSKTWFQHLKKGLLARHFTQSKLDPCLFYKDGLILVTYVDDCLIFGKQKALIDDLLKSLQKDYHLTDEGSIENYLGVHIEHCTDGSMHLTQKGLTKKVIEAVGLDLQSNPNKIPADSHLGAHLDSPPHDNTEFHYRSVIGMLNFLAGSTRPDIAMAVHQCARFSHNPRANHTAAVKRIARYLIGTYDKGMIIHPHRDKCQLDCHVDADFAGLYSTESTEHPDSARSRTGFVLSFANIPLLWVSKLQTEIALSTTEAEYMALSHSLREVIPCKELIQSLAPLFGYNSTQTNTISTIFEDNKGAQELAMCPKLRPRTKHINVKYHHFRQHVENSSITVVHQPGTEQMADMLTKPLDRVKFEKFRLALQGW